MKPDETIYAGEVQFAGWSDSHTQGPIIKIRLPSSDDLDRFRALTVAKGKQAGHRFMLCVVEIGEQEEPLPPPAPTKKSDDAPKVKNGPYCIEAIDLCRNPLFQRWVQQEHFDEEHWRDRPFSAEQLAKEFILMECGVESRKEIDGNEQAIDQFLNGVRVPFMHWQRELSE